MSYASTINPDWISELKNSVSADSMINLVFKSLNFYIARWQKI